MLTAVTATVEPAAAVPLRLVMRVVARRPRRVRADHRPARPVHAPAPSPTRSPSTTNWAADSPRSRPTATCSRRAGPARRRPPRAPG